MIAVVVFQAVRSKRGEPGRNDRKFLEALHYFTADNITWRALPAEFGNWNSVWKRFWRLSQTGTFEAFFEALASLSQTAQANVRFHHRAGACVRSGRQRVQDSQALGRSRGGFSTKIHMKTDKKGHPIGFYLTGGEASDSRNFETLLDIGPALRRGRWSPIRATMRPPIAKRRASAASAPLSPTGQTPRINRPSSPRHSTKAARGSSRHSANSSALSGSRCDARRPHRTMPPLSPLPAA